MDTTIRRPFGWAAVPVTLAIATVAVTLGGSAVAATHTVCSSGCDWTTLQAAVNAAGNGDVIQILATQPHTEPDIVVNTSLEIHGVPGFGSIVQAALSPASGAGRVLTIFPGTTVVIRDLEVRHGDAIGDGGGVLNLGHLTLVGVTVEDSQCSNDGGGIFNQGTLVMVDGDVSGNVAGIGHGGGIANAAGATLVGTGSILSFNQAARGGNLANEGSAELTRCRIRAGTAEYGGGVHNGGTLVLREVRLDSNAAVDVAANGAGVYQVGGSTVIDGGLIRVNHAGFNGGGILVEDGSLEVTDAQIAFNTAGFGGGGIAVFNGATTLTGVTVRGSTAFKGGGVWQASPTTMRIVNSTLSGNEASEDGGGIFVSDERSVSFASSTIAGNVADSDEDGDGDGGGCAYGSGCTGFCLEPRLYLKDSILAGNQDSSPGGGQAHDCLGEIVSDGYNLVEDAVTGPAGACRVIGDLTGVMTGIDPMLEPLADNGGPPATPGGDPPWTHALDPSSPAIDMGDPGGCRDSSGNLLPTDQRGAPRVGACDIGAFEFGSTPPVPLPFSDGFESGDTSAWSSALP